jgi:hypothetical protein
MPPTVSHYFFVRCIIAVVAGSILWCAPAPGTSAESPEEGRSAAAILRLLQTDRFHQAERAAASAVDADPKSGLLRLRLAQARTCRLFQETSELSNQLALASISLRIRGWARAAVEQDYAGQSKTAGIREQFQEWLAYAGGPDVAAFHQSTRAQLERSATQAATLLPEGLERIQSDFEQAAARKAPAAELETSQLWVRVLTSLLRSELSRFGTAGRRRKNPEPAPVPAEDEKIKTLLAAFSGSLGSAKMGPRSLEPDALLADAGRIAVRYPENVEALCAMADALTAVAAGSQKRDPVTQHIKDLLDHRYLANIERYNAAATPVARRAAAELYQQASRAEEPDPVQAPYSLALQLYNRAWELDKTHRLPYLPLRIYLLRVAFLREEADAVLRDLKRREPQNAALVLEEARAAFLLDNKPTEGLALCRQAARLARFSRSLVPGVPAALRPALRYHEGVRTWMRDAWPGYGWLFVTLQDMELAQNNLAAKAELQLLRLQLADRLCQATDYPDQAEGMGQKASALSALAAQGDRLPPEQRALIEKLRQDHLERSATFPTRVASLTLQEGSMEVRQVPSTRIGKPRGRSLTGLTVTFIANGPVYLTEGVPKPGSQKP